MSYITTVLRNDHDRLCTLAADFKVILANPTAPAGIELVRFRTMFAKELLAHLAREDMLLYPALKKSSDADVARISQSFVEEMGGLMTAYKEWSARWPTELATQYWPVFVSETRELLSALGTRIARENDKLYPLVEGGTRRV